MSEINNSQGPTFNKEPHQGGHENEGAVPQGISFQGEKTDLRYDPKASVNKAFIEKNIRSKIGEFDIKFGTKEIEKVKKDLEHLYNHPSAVQKATALYPAFQANALKKGYENPNAYALALENYAATHEFIKNAANS